MNELIITQFSPFFGVDAGTPVRVEPLTSLKNLDYVIVKKNDEVSLQRVELILGELSLWPMKDVSSEEIPSLILGKLVKQRCA